MPAGHKLDANTIALWRLDDAVGAGNFTTILDTSGNGFDFAITGSIDIVAGPAGVGLAKEFNSTDYGLHANDATLTSLFIGECTLEGWFYPVSASLDYLWNYGGTGETEPTNYIMGVRREASGNVSLLMERDAGTNISVSSTANLPINTWSHLAVVKQDVGGGNFDYHFYVNGSFVDTVTDLGSTGGTTAVLYLGRSDAGSNFAGTIGAQRWSNVVRSAGEIAASYARPGKDHALDGSTVIRLQMDEPPDLLDEANLAHLRLDSGTDQRCTALNNDGGYGRTFLNTLYRTGANLAIANAFLTAMHDEITVEFWGRLGTNWQTTSNRGAWVWGDPGTDVASQNFFSFDIFATTLVGRVFTENGAGINDVWDTPGAIFPEEAQWDIHHYAITSVVAGGFGTYELYVDGALVATSGGTDVAHDGGESGYWQVGSGSGTGLTDSWQGQIDDMRVSNKKRSAAEILASYEAGIVGVTYRMRGFDQNGGVNDYVYWSSAEVDTDASDYAGSAGPVVDVVVHKVLGA